ncbi:amino acid adenylation domain-containing protein [Actinoplanes sp. RD1]|uniref:amino acid adenylation domain-containing protein n=1 Tax=Actinoplanes sp. RD1 TaxID=3064538 RepID=UPI002740DAF1|nr:amino acid adenylation domain-containing protein [Actinoplanes sp. RD1]
MTDVLKEIAGAVSHAPDRVALTGAGGSWTYADLDRAAREVATRLRAAGLRPGDGVVVRARLSAWAVVAMLGTLHAGGRHVAVDTAFPVARQELMTELSGARLMLREPDDEPVALAGVVPDGVPGTAYTCFTSGSTGRPKRVDVPHACLGFSTAARLRHYAGPVRGFLLCSSISFDSAMAGIYWTLAAGGTLIVPSDRPADLVAVARAAQRHEATHLLMIPSLYRLLVSGGLSGMLGSLRTVVVAGESCPPGLVAAHYAALPETALHNEYGPTECTVWSTVHDCVPADAEASPVPIGRPLPGTSARVCDDEGREVPPGTPGELWIEGPHVAAPNAGRAYRTGDLARVRPDGALEFRGRADDQVKLGGMRVELGEIEHVLLRHGSVAAVAVGVAGRHEPRPRLVAWVVAAAGAVPAPAVLREHARRHLPAAAVPARVVVVDQLPVQPNGKVDRRRLAELTAALPVREPA